MLFETLDDATRRKAIAFLEASLKDEAPRRKVLHMASATPTRRDLRLLDTSERPTLKRCA